MKLFIICEYTSVIIVEMLVLDKPTDVKHAIKLVYGNYYISIHLSVLCSWT